MIIAKFNVFINRRDVNYLSAALTEDNYRKVLTSALNQCVDGHKTYKYSQVTDYIYKAVLRKMLKNTEMFLALTLGAYFLYKNSYFWQVTIFMRQILVLSY